MTTLEMQWFVLEVIPVSVAGLEIKKETFWESDLFNECYLNTVMSALQKLKSDCLSGIRRSFFSIQSSK